MKPDTVVARSPDALHRVLDGEAVIVDLATGTYFGLNEVGTWIWERIDGKRTAARIADSVAGEFDVEPGRAERDVLALLRRLEGKRLVAPVAAAP